ncbi:MAG: PEGA domain-containing protein [Kiritimatiellales bacterium]|nr:PEGA domain-containing protein [Kiritimatiellales bacterium]
MRTKLFVKAVAVAVVSVAFISVGCAPVTISSTPAGAEVYDKGTGELVGETPTKVNIYHSGRKVLVKKPGYFAKTVDVKSNSPKSVSVDMTPMDRLILTSQPSGAEIYVPGQDRPVGRTPFELSQTGVSYELRLSGYKNKMVSVPSDPERNVRVELQREPTVMLSSKPGGAMVSQSGKFLGETPLAVEAAGTVALDIRKAGYNAKKITLGPKSAAQTTVVLDREPSVIIYSKPANAVVSLNGRVVGKTPFSYLATEQATFEVKADKFYPAKVTVSSKSPSRVDAVLKPMPYVTIDSAPTGANLFRLGGVEQVGTTPVSILIATDTMLELRKPGYEVKTFALSSASEKNVKVTLVKNAVSKVKSVTVNSKPSGAKIYRPGGAELLGTTPLKQTVPAEKTLELQLKGYVTKIVTVSPESPETVTFKLEKEEKKGPGDIVIGDPLLNTPTSF